MASTRNKNTCGDYRLEQDVNHFHRDYLLYNNSSTGEPFNPAFAGDGVNFGKMPRNVLSQNPIDIESTLFGIGSTNLVNPKKPTLAKINKIQEKPFMTKMALTLPDPLVVEKNQRPFLIP